MAKRRRGSRAARHRSTHHRPFSELVDVALAAIPEPFASALGEVAVVIADEPTRDQIEKTVWNQEMRCTGCTKVSRGPNGARIGPIVPSRITLFRLPLEEDFADPDDLADEVWITVIHELAHHLGIDDERLEELGVD